tara:strand:- start:3629 stop:3808 length:180 start_codon:yes stop_codon:yes gene_type:complete
MLYFSEGGFTHSEIYGMPIYLRNFYYRELASVKKEEKKQMNNASKKSKVSTPNIPRYKK